MATKIEYKVGDKIRIKCGKVIKIVEITYTTKWYITCGKEYEFHADTFKCTSNQWQIIGLANPIPEKKRGLPRGKSWKEQGIIGRTLRVKTTKQ